MNESLLASDLEFDGATVVGELNQLLHLLLCLLPCLLPRLLPRPRGDSRVGGGGRGGSE